MRFITLTALESGTPIHVGPELFRKAIIKTGMKYKEAEAVVIGQGDKNKIVYSTITFENNATIAVRETPDEVTLLTNGH